MRHDALPTIAVGQERPARGARRAVARPRLLVVGVLLTGLFQSASTAVADPPGSLQFVPAGLPASQGSVLRMSTVEQAPRDVGQPLQAINSSELRLAPMGLPTSRVQVRPTALLNQPDAPRSPSAQPIPLPPPSETIAPASPTGPVSPPTYGDYGIRPIGSLTINILPKEGQVPRETDPTSTLDREFGATEYQRIPLNYSYYWESPAFFNQPLYFEQPNLERYGYDWGIGQFWISGAQFFVKIPLLPYMMVVHPPRERVYSLGYYRPGSRAPYQINWPEVRLDAISMETAYIVGLCFLIP
ncbi:MAG TPA: hypothetical protein VHD36_14555 [Pirellulales bacterium]|nr:hypothetical protein [Pirellulales bacterium]